MFVSVQFLAVACLLAVQCNAQQWLNPLDITKSAEVIRPIWGLQKQEHVVLPSAIGSTISNWEIVPGLVRTFLHQIPNPFSTIALIVFNLLLKLFSATRSLFGWW